MHSQSVESTNEERLFLSVLALNSRHDLAEWERNNPRTGAVEVLNKHDL